MIAGTKVHCFRVTNSLSGHVDVDKLKTTIGKLFEYNKRPDILDECFNMSCHNTGTVLCKQFVILETCTVDLPLTLHEDNTQEHRGPKLVRRKLLKMSNFANLALEVQKNKEDYQI